MVRVEKVPKDAGKGEKPFEVATVEVTKTLKGDDAPNVKFLLRNYREPEAQQWLDDGIQLLFCLVTMDRARAGDKALPKGVDWVLRDDGIRHSAILLGKMNRGYTYTTKAFTRKFEVLTEPAAITKLVEDYIKSIPEGWKKQSHMVDVPSDTQVYKKLWSASAVFLTLPVDDHLESLGREWCKSKSAITRLEGTKILRYFNNDGNISVLKSLLDDPDSTIQEKYTTRDGKPELVLVYRKRVFEIRKAAYEALQDFGIKVSAPLIEEVLAGKDEQKGQPRTYGR